MAVFDPPVGKTVKELKKQIRETRKEMKELGVRRTSFMNSGLTPNERCYNEEMFRLETLLKERIAQGERNGCKDGNHNWPVSGGLCYCGEAKWKN